MCRRQRELTATISCRPSLGALHLLIDSTGIKAAGEGEWSTRKRGAAPGRLCCTKPLRGFISWVLGGSRSA